MRDGGIRYEDCGSKCKWKSRTVNHEGGGLDVTAVVRGENRSEARYADYAVAMVDEIIEGEHIQERNSVVRK